MGGRERSGWACRAFQRQKNRPFGEGERPACEASWGRLFSSQKLLVGATRVLTCRSGGRCRSFAARYIGHQPHVDAAVLGTAIGGLIALHRLVLAQSDHVNLVSGNVVLACQVLNDGGRTTLAQVVVVVRGANGIRATFHGYQIAPGLSDLACKLGEGFLRVFG